MGSNLPKIAITGKMRSGKSSIAAHLVGEYGFVKISFGGELKHYADKIFPRFSEGGRKPRQLYQSFGQKMREIDPDVWIHHAEQSAEMWQNLRTTRGIVIDDLRQPNEYGWAKANGFVLVRINASEGKRLERARLAGDNFALEDLRHETELHVDDFEVDYEITNDGEDITEIWRQVDEIVSENRS